MLIELTNRCFENCTHCMVDAKPDGKHMDDEIIQHASKFINIVKPWVVVISGGEISTIPNFREVITNFINSIKIECCFLLQSNGTWIFNENDKIEMAKLLMNPRILNMQVSTNKKYYTSYEKIMEVKDSFKTISEKIEFFNDWQGESTNMLYLGRAQNIMSENDVKGKPGCGVLMSIIKQLHLIREFSGNENDFIKLIKILETKGYFCKPMISVNGNVYVSETQYCMKMFNVKDLPVNGAHDFLNNVIEKTKSFHFCDKCKARKNVPINILNQLGL